MFITPREYRTHNFYFSFHFIYALSGTLLNEFLFCIIICILSGIICSIFVHCFVQVLGGFDSSNYTTERKWATASDGTKIPISIVYKKNLVKLDGSDPLLLYGYGSYEICLDPGFNASRLSLIDRGFIFAIAHIRGGGEMGRQWYENGKLLKKKSTFTDFIACAEYLIEQKYCSKEKLCIEGRSAGGLLIGSVLNMRPDLFKAAVAGVPFVDVVTTMLDPTIPLTTSEWEEWGDPRKEEFYFYMKSYSPVDNVKAQKYPNILVTAGLNDPRVLYSEPAKFVAKLRDTKTDDNILLFKCELGAGHFSKSGRFEKLQEDAFTYAFVMKALNMIPALVSGEE
uniref:Prolyl endopeptidase n=1 Tax=Rhizophora mucronata TaxID=61149 RepID=A0A2P2K0W6_RHIMU